MDPNQFKEFMALLSTALVREPSSTPQIAPFENYDAKKEKFSSYLERFENYCDLKNIQDEIKKQQLMCSSVGREHYNNLAAFLGPETPIKDISYTSLIGHFKKLLSPSVSVVVSQHYFLSVTQQPNQSIAEFVAVLKGNLKDCDFYATCSCKKKLSIADNFLRAQFIRGLRDNCIREHLLQETSLKDFESILKKAISLEASRIESDQLSKIPDTSSCNLEDTNRVERQSSQRGQLQSHRRSQSNHSQQFYGSMPSRTSRRVDYRALGIESLCLKCARSNHRSHECRINRESLKCKSCGKIGHVAKVCITTLLQKSNTHSLMSQHQEYEDISESEQEFGVVHIGDTEDLYEIGPEMDKYIITVTLNNKPQSFEVDSGARFSLLSETDFHKLGLNIPIQRTSVSFRSYSDHIIKPKGKVTVKVTYKDKSMNADLFIVPAGHAALLGRIWIRELGINLNEIDSYHDSVNSTDVNQLNSPEDIFKKYSDIFEERIGCVPNLEVKLQLKEGVKPVFIRERDVPFALRERVEKELVTLESQGIITPVASTDWGSPLVVIAKPDGGVRLCVDYKCGVNSRLVAAHHPIRRIDEVLHSLRGSKFFCKLDLYKAYLHLKVDEEGSKIQTISTHKGTFRMNRLSFGIKTAPSEFNRILMQLLYGLPKVEAYFDDIVCHGATREECMKNLLACLDQLQKCDLHLNKGKCSFFKENIEYLGHIISFNKIEKCPKKVKAVAQMPRPKNTDEIRRFLGLVTYYAKFIPKFSTRSYPLRRLLHKGKNFYWSPSAEASFLDLKAELCSDRVLISFDPTKQVILTTDASPTGIAAILSHEIDGEERPVAYASRALTQAESNYSQLDREALAIVYASTHFFNYIYGKHFILITDNEPLSRIFHPNKALPQMTSARLLRYASFLSGLDYTVRCKKGRDNENVDCLSRAPVSPSKTKSTISIDKEINTLFAETLLQISSSTITAEIVAAETAKDPELKKVIETLKSSRTESPFTVSGNLLFRSERVVIPKALQRPILEELHLTHLGCTKMKQLARRYVYWERLDKDIEGLVRSCESCAQVRHNLPKAPLHPSEQPHENWERVHIDFAGPFDGRFFLMCVDAKSKWAEVRILQNAPSSSSTIGLLENIFSVHGYPFVIVSDNASVFKSEEFIQYCQVRGIFQKFSAPYHPATNGLAERNIQTLKRRLKAAADDPAPISSKLQQIMFRYRATPLASGQSPAELYLKRKIRIRLDALLPNDKARVASSPVTGRVRSFQVGERVQTRIQNQWQFGTVNRKLGHYHYFIELDSGRSLKLHINQLLSTLVPKKCVRFAQQSHGIPFPSDQPEDKDQPSSHIEPADSQPQIPPANCQNWPTSDRPARERKLPEYLKDYVI